MIRKLLLPAVALAFAAAPLVADDKPKTEPTKGEKAKKEVKLDGKLVCTKCELNETKACGHALVVKEKKDGKETEVTYYLNDSGATEKYHKMICTEPKEATVKGKLGEEKGKEGKMKKVIIEPKVEVKG